MDKTCKATDLFVKLSPPVASALALHLLGNQPGPLGLEGRSLLFCAWYQLGEHGQQSAEPALLRMLELSERRARTHVLEHARLSWAERALAAVRVLDAVSTADLAVRLYLEDQAAFERAYLQYLTMLFEQVGIYHGQYPADVIPSYDRRARMWQALRALAPNSKDGEALEEAESVDDDRFMLALHHRAKLSRPRRFDASAELAPDLSQPEIELAVLFRFDLSMLAVKASTFVDREALREAFTRIFVGDTHYFETRPAPKPRFRLTIAGPAATRPKPRKERESKFAPYAFR